MNTPNSFSSNLDVSAAEFVPTDDEAKKIALGRVRGMVEPIFEDGKHFDTLLPQLHQVALLNAADGSFLVGEILADLATTAKGRTAIGFRFFMKLRDSLSEAHRKKLDSGLFKKLHHLTRQLVTEQSESSGLLRHSGGDVPNGFLLPMCERWFCVLSLLHLVITRLNASSNPDEQVCVPPGQPCTDLCDLLDCLLRVQLNYDRSNGPNDSDPQYSPMNIFSQNDWIGLLYYSFDVFYQCCMYIHCFLVGSASSILNGSWAQNGDSNYYEIATQLSHLWNTVLSTFKELLLDEKLPLKLLRSLVLDILLCVNQLSSTLPTTATGWSESLEGGSMSLEDEVTESFEKFLEETNQIQSS